MMIKVWFVLSCLMVAACSGDDSGMSGDDPDPGDVPSDRLLNKLSESEAESFCNQWVAATITFECEGEQFSFGPASQEECIESMNVAKAEAPNCPATVGQVLACMNGLGALNKEQLCDGNTELPQSCELLSSEECLGI